MGISLPVSHPESLTSGRTAAAQADDAAENAAKARTINEILIIDVVFMAILVYSAAISQPLPASG
jgi:hypothetical protein